VHRRHAHFGGTVIAADESSSTHSSMPGETIARDHAVDFVCFSADIADLLVQLSVASLLSGG
jgi:chemotaxis response regulator CheB